MSLSAKNKNRTGTVYILTVLTQCVRLPSLIMQYKAASVFNSIIPLVFRVIFIIFAVIYFFSALTFNRFCDVLNADKVQAEIDAGADDFISPWIDYSNLLNFRTFAGSLFTMFEISIIGNWSAIMNSARKEERYWPMFWLFSFRLMMLLCIYPILNSFIIAAYIARKDLQSKEQQEKKEAQLLNDAKFLDDLERAEGMMEMMDGEREGDIELGSIGPSRGSSDVDDLSEVKLEINAGTSAMSMISFWSVSGTERYVPKSKPSATKNDPNTSTSASSANDEIHQLQLEVARLREEAVQREMSILESERRESQLREELKSHQA